MKCEMHSKNWKKEGLVIKNSFFAFFVFFFEKEMKFPKLQLLAYTKVQGKFPIIQYLPEGLATNDDKIMIFSENMEMSCTLRKVRSFFEAIVGVFFTQMWIVYNLGKSTLKMTKNGLYRIFGKQAQKINRKLE